MKFSRAIRPRISYIIRRLKRKGQTLLQYKSEDTPDSRPLRSQRISGQPFLGPSRDQLSSITRTKDGKFVVDQGSDEGGFTSPRRPIRSLTRRLSSITNGVNTSIGRWVNLGVDYCFRPTRVEGGSYDVRSGRAQPISDDIDEIEGGSYDVRTGEMTRSRDEFVYDISGSYYGIQSVATRPIIHHPQHLDGSFRPFRQDISPDPGWARVSHAEFGEHVIMDASRSEGGVRYSSPHQYADEINRLAQLASFHEVSSVRQPSSAEKSTLMSSMQTSLQKTPLLEDGTPLTSSRVPHQERLQPGRSREHVRVRQPQSTHGYYYPQYSSWVQRDPVIVSPRFRYMRGPSNIFMHHPPYRDRYPLRQPSRAIVHPNYANMLRSYPRLLPSRHPGVYPGSYPTSNLLMKASDPKPLATSSPPRGRAVVRKSVVKTGVRSPPDFKSQALRESSIESDSGSEQVRGFRDRIPKSIAKSPVKSLLERPHSAPNLSISSDPSFEGRKNILSRPRKAKKFNEAFSHEMHEISDELTSSSGFGSKNTSQQQSSSQSGQSASYLDSSGAEVSVGKHSYPRPESVPHYQNLKVTLPPPTEPFPYDWQQGRREPLVGLLPAIHRRQKSVLVKQPSPIYQNTQIPIEYSMKPPIPPRPAESTQPPALDISVDDHYEFDTLLSPMPDESDSLWGRSQSTLGERGLSDSELYESSTKKREDQMSMEERVAAMKREFHEYRRKQEKKRAAVDKGSIC